jgi:Zn-dependent peptidase ImmA (M78 family)
MPVKNHSNEDLETIAENFLAQRARGKYDGHSLRIEALIESTGYYIFQIPGLAEIAEAYIPAMPGYIFVDEEQYLNGISFRWRFTIAEELAHVLIHRPLFEGKSSKEIIKIQDGYTDADYRIIEKNAKFLAGSILMPRGVFRERFAHFQALQSQRSANVLDILKYAVRQLSRDFNVSCYAVALRALHLEIIDQQQLDDLIESFGW